MNKWHYISYPKYFNKLSKELSKLRSKLSKDVYKKGTDKYRGEQEERISALGVLAELIAHNYCTEKNIKFYTAPLIDLKPQQYCDIYMEDEGKEYKIDVKGVKKSGKFLRINYKAHNNKNKEITHYMFIHILSDNEARYIFYTHQDIYNWEIANSTYSQCYKIKINNSNI